MLVLGVESSCDETAIALVRDGREVLSSKIASQTALHAVFGGVVPEVASREHLRVIAPLCRQALAEAGVGLGDVDAIAVTRGPGLIGALLVGVSYAKGLALALGKPLVPVDHVHAHVHGALLGVDAPPESFYPALAFVVSGGHTNLYAMTSPTSFHLLANSIDDACGECFDKVAKLLGLPYPGGPEIEKLARGGRADALAMPRMVDNRSRLEFSYSGLKTYMANLLAAETAPLTPARLADVCASFQDEALGQIARKAKAALALRPGTKAVLVAGGVAANQRFRALLEAAVGRPCYFPHPRFCSDNAAMIAAYGYHVFREGRARGETFLNHDWDAYSRYDFVEAARA
jgi:N6-L-threonylcarbamoyladenine synthase